MSDLDIWTIIRKVFRWVTEHLSFMRVDAKVGTIRSASSHEKRDSSRIKIFPKCQRKSINLGFLVAIICTIPDVLVLKKDTLWKQCLALILIYWISVLWNFCGDHLNGLIIVIVTCFLISAIHISPECATCIFQCIIQCIIILYYSLLSCDM